MSVFAFCYAHQHCMVQYVFLLECGQSTYLSTEVSFVYCESRMVEERVQSTEAHDKSPGCIQHLKHMKY